MYWLQLFLDLNNYQAVQLHPPQPVPGSLLVMVKASLVGTCSRLFLPDPIGTFWTSWSSFLLSWMNSSSQLLPASHSRSLPPDPVSKELPTSNVLKCLRDAVSMFFPQPRPIEHSTDLRSKWTEISPSWAWTHLTAPTDIRNCCWGFKHSFGNTLRIPGALTSTHFRTF